MRALIAFDKFKDCMSAPDACAAAAAALRGCRPEWSLDLCPLADGGEGFVEILTTAARGGLNATTVAGPRGQSISAQFGLVRTADVPHAAAAALGLGLEGTIAVIEVAAASGLALLAPAERNVWHTSTRGTGELIRAAADAGARAIVVGVGGSATNDLGLGALTALGLRLETSEHVPTDAAPAEWPQIARLTGTLGVLPPIFIACDVTNPLLGPHGAAAVYGPQKGLQSADVKRLDHEAARMALMLCGHFGRPDKIMAAPGAGAAGGIAFGLMCALGAQLLPGYDFVAQWLDLDARIKAADVVITGEGRFDQSSLAGKGPGALAQGALAQRKQVAIFAGAISATVSLASLQLHAISPAEVPLAQALRDGPENLTGAVRKAFSRRSELS